MPHYDPEIYLPIYSRRISCDCADQPGEREELTFTPRAMFFDYLQVGLISVSQPITITNTGTVSVGVSEFTATGDFEILDPDPVALNVGDSHVINVRFKPTLNGVRQGDISVKIGNQDRQDVIHLTGLGGQPNVKVNWPDIIDSDPVNNPMPVHTGKGSAPFGSKTVSQVLTEADSLLQSYDLLAQKQLDDYLQHEAMLHLNGQPLSTVIVDEQQQRIQGDQALVDTLAILGAKSGDGTAFVLDTIKIRVTPVQSLAQKLAAMESSTSTVQANLDAQVLSLTQTVTNETMARAAQYDMMSAALVTESGERQAQYQSLSETMVTEFDATALRIDNMQVTFNDEINTMNVRIDNVETAYADADTAIASDLQRVAVSGSLQSLSKDPTFESFSLFWESYLGSLPVRVTGQLAGRSAFHATTESWFNEKARIPVDPNRRYRVRGNFRRGPNAAQPCYLGVRVFDANGNNIAGEGDWWFYPAYGDPGTNWVTWSGDFGFGTAKPFPTNAVSFAPGAILSYQPTAAGWSETEMVWIEDVSTSTKLAAEVVRLDQAVIDAKNGAVAEALVQVNTSYGGTKAAVEEIASATSSPNTAAAQRINSMTVTLNNHTGRIEQVEQATAGIDGITLKYGVRLDNNGFITGFEQLNNGSSGSFIISANHFAIGTPGVNYDYPFQVLNGITYIKNAVIQGQAIDTPKIADFAVTKMSYIELGSVALGNSGFVTLSGPVATGNTTYQCNYYGEFGTICGDYPEYVTQPVKVAFTDLPVNTRVKIDIAVSYERTGSNDDLWHIRILRRRNGDSATDTIIRPAQYSLRARSGTNTSPAIFVETITVAGSYEYFVQGYRSQGGCNITQLTMTGIASQK